MKQATHAWIAIRAVGLLDGDADTKGLVGILKPSLDAAAIGAWLPDLEDSKLGSGDMDNHVFKMEPYSGELEDRFVTTKADILKRLGTSRETTALIAADKTLDAAWWGTPFKASPGPVQNIANRAQALTTTLADALILGDRKVAINIPRKFKLSEQLDAEERTRQEQVALYFFMLSHFVADACMPCHCDARKLASYDGKLHPEWEKAMDKIVGKTFADEQLSAFGSEPSAILKAAEDVDKAAGVKFDSKIPIIKDNDVWKETVAICRASFALSNMLANPADYPFEGRKTLSFKDLMAGLATQACLTAATAAVLHDAVLNVATVWKFVWRRFSAK